MHLIKEQQASRIGGNDQNQIATMKENPKQFPTPENKGHGLSTCGQNVRSQIGENLMTNVDTAKTAESL
jgi:hypothetical protein